MGKKCVIEARINEYAKRGNKYIPYTIDEIVREAEKVQKAGATVLHMHARTPDGGADNSVEGNAKLIRKIRENTDLFIHSTLGFITNDDTPENRIENIRILCEDLKCGPDIVPIDIGSCNLEKYDRENGKVTGCDVYLNRTETIFADGGKVLFAGCECPIFLLGRDLCAQSRHAHGTGPHQKKASLCF